MLSRNLEKAKEAFKKKSVDATIAAHNAMKSAEELHNTEQGKYIKSLVYGGLDGIITTFAAVAGVAGAKLNISIVLIMGFANLIADGLSMAIGDYLSTKAENDYNRAERAREAWEVEHYPDGEKKELVELYVHKGLSEEDAVKLTEIISKNKSVWVDVMMKEELGIIESDESPLKNALVTFFSFCFFGFIPLIIFIMSLFIVNIPNPFIIACVLTGITLFLLGALKVKITGQNWFIAGLETFLVGGVAALSAYGVGVLLGGIVG